MKPLTSILRKTFLSTIFYCFLLVPFFAQKNIKFNNSNGFTTKRENIRIFIDTDEIASAKDLLSNSSNKYFKNSIADLKILSDFFFWHKLKLPKEGNNQINIIEIECPEITEIKIFTSRKNTIDSVLPNLVELTVKKSRNSFFVVEVPSFATQVLIKADGKQFINYKLDLYSKADFFKKERFLNFHIGLSLGIVLLVMFYHLLLYFKVRDKIYLYYLVLIFFAALIITNNISALPGNIFFKNILFALFQVSAITICIEFIGLKQQNRQSRRFLLLFIPVIILIEGFNSFFFNAIFEFLFHFESLILYSTIILLSIKGQDRNRTFVLAWGLLLLSHFTYILHFLELLHIYWFAENVIELGIVFNIVFIALAFGNKIGILKSEKKTAEAKEIEALIERDKFIQEQNLILEDLIKERHKKIINKNELFDKQRLEIEKQNKKIESSNKKLDKINHELFKKNEKIITQNREIERKHQILEQTVNRRTKKLLLAKENAIVAERLKTSFLNNLTQEIRTPMTAITGFSSLLVDKSLSKEKRKEYLNTIIHNVDILLESIENIITLAKIQTRIIRPKITDFELKPLFSICKDRFEAKLQSSGKKKISLKIGAKKAIEDLIIKSDYDKIWQILYKLIDNSIKYTDKGLVEVSYDVQNKENGNTTENQLLHIHISDTGIGIEPEKLEFIFEQFNKIEDDKTRLYHGAGLGLAIAKGLIDVLNGKIEVHSILNEGSTFSVKIPIIVKKNESVQNNNSK